MYLHTNFILKLIENRDAAEWKQQNVKFMISVLKLSSKN